MILFISEYSYKPLKKRKNGILSSNPGSAGIKGFNLPVSLAEIQSEVGKISAKIILLDI